MGVGCCSSWVHIGNWVGNSGDMVERVVEMQGEGSVVGLIVGLVIVLVVMELRW